MNCPNWTYGWRNYAHPPRLSPTHSPWTLWNTTGFRKSVLHCMSEWYIFELLLLFQNTDIQPHHVHTFHLSGHNLYGYMICHTKHLLCHTTFGWIHVLSNLIKKGGNIKILHLNDFVFAAGHFCSCRWVLLYSHSVLACPPSSITKTCHTYSILHTHIERCTQTHTRMYTEEQQDQHQLILLSFW